jgi:uncharacterized protein (TIGR02145 family)
MVLRFFLLAGTFLLASCVSIERNNPDDPGSSNYKAGGIRPSSSSESNVVYGSPVIYEGETYQTVVIGTQTWFKRNLNYAASGKCYDNKEANCATYGRLYDWATAMALPSSCNTDDCASQIGTKHKGICPSGWHIPSDEEWITLTEFVGGSLTAGIKLKAINGWDSFMENFNGTDNYGFSALPGGTTDGDDFYGVTRMGSWWTSTTGTNGNYNTIDYLHMEYNKKDVFIQYAYGGINSLKSVRCVRD